MICNRCGKPSAAIKDGKLIVTHTANDHAAQFGVKGLIDAMTGDEKSLMVLRDKFDEGFLEFITR